MKKNIVQSLVIGFLLIGISLPLLMPYFHQGYFPTHDGEWAVVRLADMFRSLRDHQFPVRFSGNLNFAFGYPLFNFAYPAPYYVGTLFHFLRFGFVDTIKLLFGMSIVFSAISMYFLAKELWQNKFAGIISAVFYLYFPYRIVDLYARGSLGESLSFALFPLILFCAAKLFDKKYHARFFLGGVISYSLLIMTHNIMALLFTPILFLFLAMKIFVTKGKEYGKAVLFVLLSFGVSAFFWIPALMEKHFIRLSEIPIADRSLYFVQLSQLVLPQWGYGLPDHADGFSYQLGIAYIIVVLITLIVLLTTFFIKRNNFKTFSFQIATLFFVILIIALLFMFSFTAFLWQSLPLLREINYPWTLLGISGLLISLLSGFLWRGSMGMKYCVALLAVLAIVFTLPYAKPASYFDKGDAYYLTNEATTTSSNELMPLWVKKDPVNRWEQKVAVVNGKGTIENSSFTSQSGVFMVNADTTSTLRVNTIYYPGWKVFVDKKAVQIDHTNPTGVIEFVVGKGTHLVTMEFGETSLRLMSDVISLVSLLVLLFLSMRFKILKI